MSEELICRCFCDFCDEKCIHYGAERRMPREEGGLALCPKLKDDSDPIWKQDKSGRGDCWIRGEKMPARS